MIVTDKIKIIFVNIKFVTVLLHMSILGEYVCMYNTHIASARSVYILI